MGMGIHDLLYLTEKGYLGGGDCRIMDIGSQNLYNADEASIRHFVSKNSKKINEKILPEESKRLSYFSTPRPGERTAYISELIDLTDIFYTSYDVCPALKTEIFDLNRQSLPDSYVSSFDVVLNFGTTEHVFNQLNSFKVMHECMKTGGVAFHQLPSIGWIDHSYFNYHWVFFEDLIRANGYELLDHWYTPAGITTFDTERVDLRSAFTPGVPRSGYNPDMQTVLPCYNINAVFRKVVDKPFSVGLELATSHSALSSEMEVDYGGAKGGLAMTSAETIVASEQHAPRVIVREVNRVENIRATELFSELVKRVRRKVGV